MNDLDSDLDWEISFILEDLKDDLEHIFEKVKSNICYAYSSPKQISIDTRSRIRDEKIINHLAIIEFMFMDFLTSKSYEYFIMVDTVLSNLAYENLDEGFSDELWKLPIHEKLFTAMNEIVDNDWTFNDLLKCLRAQHCQLFR